MTGPLTLRRGVMVYGGFSGTEATLAARPSRQYTTITGGQTVVVGASRARLDGFIIKNGNASFVGSPSYVNGGGMLNDGVTDLLVNNCRFEKNAASQRGAAMYNTGATSVTVEDTVFVENKAYYGGAIYNDQQASLTLRRVRFEKNIARVGGAIYNDTGTLVVSDSLFATNGTNFNVGAASDSTTPEGGAILNKNGAPEFVNVIFYDNDSLASGGVANNSTIVVTPKFTNCMFANNSSASGGSSLTDSGSAASKIVNVTFAFDQSANGAMLSGTSSTQCVNCVVVGKLGTGPIHNLPAPHFLASYNETTNASADAGPFTSVMPDDTNGDGVPDFFLNQIDANPCFNHGNDQAATDAGIPWNTLTTSATGCRDSSPVDMGYHFTTSNSSSCI